MGGGGGGGGGGERTTPRLEHLASVRPLVHGMV